MPIAPSIHKSQAREFMFLSASFSTLKYFQKSIEKQKKKLFNVYLKKKKSGK